MKLHFSARFAPLVIFLSPFAAAQNDTNWIDEQHHSVESGLDRWANHLNTWLGDTDPGNPASAALRLMLDNEWNRYDGYTFKPRVRARIKLPILKKRLSVVLGDDDLDNELRDNNRIGQNYQDPLKNRHYDARQSRSDNASLALRWSQTAKRLGVKTDFDIGVRATSDVYARFKAARLWKMTDRVHFGLEQIYRYGIQSHHYLRTNAELRYLYDENSMLANHSNVQYTYKTEGNTTWGNSTFLQHNYSGFKQLNYGIFISGSFDRAKNRLNQYGPFVNWRQPIWRSWLFIQPELHYYNNRDNDRRHHIGAFFRLEAMF